MQGKLRSTRCAFPVLGGKYIPQSSVFWFCSALWTVNESHSNKLSDKTNTYCRRRSDSLAVKAEISPKERRMSSLSLGSSHSSATFRASAIIPRICSSPSLPPLGSASQFLTERSCVWVKINSNIISIETSKQKEIQLSKKKTAFKTFM